MPHRTHAQHPSTLRYRKWKVSRRPSLVSQGAGKRAISRDKEDEIRVVNFRTWQIRMMPLDRVLWVPMYRLLGHDGTEELITLAGPPKKRPSSKIYNLAVIQQVRQNQVTVEAKELVEQETFFAPDCQELRQIPGGDAITEEICRRVLAIQEYKSIMAAAFSVPGTTAHGTSCTGSMACITRLPHWSRLPRALAILHLSAMRVTRRGGRRSPK